MVMLVSLSLASSVQAKSLKSSGTKEAGQVTGGVVRTMRKKGQAASRHIAIRGFAAALWALAMSAAIFAPAASADTNDRLPDGQIARASGDGPVAAWYGRPTRRYRHGVLGDDVEGGSLLVVDSRGTRHEIVLSDEFVFEDITPRIADLDGDGSNEVVAIRTDMRAGAALAIYGLRYGALVELAATAPIGRPNRWLSVAAIADFRGEGRNTIAVVKTPHIGGILELYRLGDGCLETVRGPTTGYSTHRIGSRELTLALAVDLDGDGRPELVLPDQTLRRIVALDLSTGVSVRHEWPLPEPVAGRVVATAPGVLRVPLESGRHSVLRTRGPSP